MICPGIVSTNLSVRLRQEPSLKRVDSGVSLGAIVHCNNNNSIWIQESYSKVVTVPWYTTASIGYTYSWESVWSEENPASLNRLSAASANMALPG